MNEDYDSMEEGNEPEFVTYKSPVGTHNNNAKNANGSYQLCSHGHPLRSHVDKKLTHDKDSPHYNNNLEVFKVIASAGVEVDEAVATGMKIDGN